MKAKTRMKISFVMVAFVIITSFSISTINHLRERDHVIESYYATIEQIEEIVTYTIEMIDKAYYYFDDDISANMEEISLNLVDKYMKNPNFNEWNFQQLKQETGMEIYIINNENTITHSSFEKDIGINFKECCTDFSSLLDERRNSGAFYTDGMDLQQTTGDVLKYSYIPTPDKQYIIELGYSLEDDLIFQEFNVLQVIKDLVARHDTLNDIHILNTDGFIYGELTSSEYLNEGRKAAFEKTIKTGEMTEVKSETNDEHALYRYVFYSADESQGLSTNRVLEIVYNDESLQNALTIKRNVFLIQLVIIFVVTSVISYIIHRWVAKQVHHAYHDSLTGLKNRVTFDELFQKYLTENRDTTVLMMIDLDNFKIVNDRLGHLQGDKLLKLVAKTIDQTVPYEHDTFRLGGDEFAVILPKSSRDQAEVSAKYVSDAIKEELEKYDLLCELCVTASVGISLAPEQGNEVQTLYKKADIALYQSKEKGKNQYHVYTERMTFSSDEKRESS